MSETTNLHWSFNHDRTEQSPDFAQQLRSLVKGTLETTASSDGFWNQWSGVIRSGSRHWRKEQRRRRSS